jgi:hypothetical protein
MLKRFFSNCTFKLAKPHRNFTTHARRCFLLHMQKYCIARVCFSTELNVSLHLTQRCHKQMQCCVQTPPFPAHVTYCKVSEVLSMLNSNDAEDIPKCLCLTSQPSLVMLRLQSLNPLLQMKAHEPPFAGLHLAHTFFIAGVAAHCRHWF